MTGQPEQAVRRRASVSILLCNYNDARFLPDSLGGICGQTRPADEIIVVDDGSTDDSVAIIESFAASCPNLRLLRNDQNRGLMYSIKRALDEARMEYVVWAAADDVLLPTFVERNLALLEQHPEAVMSFSRLATFVDGSNEVTHYTPDVFRDAFDLGDEAVFMNAKAFHDRLHRSYLWMSGNTVVVRRDKLIEAGGFDEALRWHADWFTFYSIGLRYGACVIPETLAMMRERPGTFSGSGIKNKIEQRATLISILETLARQQNRDLRQIVRQRPSVLSPFGKEMLFAMARHPRSWRLGAAYGRWLADHWLKAHNMRYRDLVPYFARAAAKDPRLQRVKAAIPVPVKAFIKKALRL
jgi:glycosyltransferase involved in cell wall biosynthesis